MTRVQTVNTTYHRLVTLPGWGSVCQTHCQDALLVIFPYRTLWKEVMVYGLHCRVASLFFLLEEGASTQTIWNSSAGEMSLLHLFVSVWANEDFVLWVLRQHSFILLYKLLCCCCCWLCQSALANGSSFSWLLCFSDRTPASQGWGFVGLLILPYFCTTWCSRLLLPLS